MKLSSIPVVHLPLVDLSTDPLDLLLMGLALRMKQLARTS
ncbi:MAG TPA: SCP-2 sterol transfer family protein, partial [Acinetobacter radioresistens]|nr:SCP-2 sterol transfer family protein [Acinetobacter radioresistens]